MSVRVQSWVWHSPETQELRGSLVLVALALADVANDAGEVVFVDDATGTQRALAAKARVSRRTFQRCVDELESLGLLERTDGKSAGTACQYRLLVDGGGVRQNDAPGCASLAQGVRQNGAGGCVTSGAPGASPVAHPTSIERIDVDMSTNVDMPVSKSRTPSKPTPAAEPEGFAWFWTIYPRRVKRPRALAAYRAAMKRATEDEILRGAEAFARDPNLPDETFIPHPATWLNGDSWNDGPLPPRELVRGGLHGALAPSDDWMNGA